MGALHDLSDMSRDYGLGMKYFLLIGGVIAALMLALFLWGRVVPPVASVTAPATAPAEAPAATGAPTSY